jgi:hypothetical protein
MCPAYDSKVRESGHGLRVAVALCAIVMAVVALIEWSGIFQAKVQAESTTSDTRGAGVSGGSGPDFAKLATRSIKLLEDGYYNGTGLWHMCYPKGTCNTKNRDWGADALTNIMYLRWELEHDKSVLKVMDMLAQTARLWGVGQRGSSDSVTWDAVAEVRLYQVTGYKTALHKAEAALNYVDSTKGLASGACPAIEYQWPYGALGGLKTIETTTNFIKAALLLYQVTGIKKYLTAAEGQYTLVRRYFLDKKARLYTSYMFDNGRTCRVLPGQYFASVNGNMIWNGQDLAALTGDSVYLRQALATAHGIRKHLSDGDGVFADLQADNDIVGPLVEGMYALATTYHSKFARHWLLFNASAAGADQTSQGAFGRFFDGPPPSTQATAWQTSGGMDLMVAAAALDPHGHPADPTFWQHATYVPDVAGLVPDPTGNPTSPSPKSTAAAHNGTSTTTGSRPFRHRRHSRRTSSPKPSTSSPVPSTSSPAPSTSTSLAPSTSSSPKPSPSDSYPPGTPVVTINFTGRAIAILGTIGADCCSLGHARVFIDGVQTYNRAGIWQDYSSPSRRQYNQVLFAWRWRKSGHHVITIKPGIYDPEEGGSFFEMTGYLVVK